MRESIHRYFQIGTISWMSFPGKDAVDTVRRIAEDDFFDAIELTRFDSEEERARAKRLLDQSHLKVCYGAQPRLLGPGLNPNDLNEEGRLKAQATLIEAVDEAEALGARGVAFLAGKWAQETREEAYAQLLRTTRAVCAYAEGKGMDVNLEVFDYDMDKAALIGPAPLAARFAADVLSLHCPLTPENTGMVNRETIGRMKDGVILINTARGPLIQEDALREALVDGKVYAAALDVVSAEPIRPDNPLLGLDNCLITPHIAWASRESRQRLMDIAVANLEAFLSGKPANVVNP